MPKKQPTRKTVEAIKHDDDKRKNIPTAEFQPVLNKEEQKPLRVTYDRRNRDLDPQLVWRGKDEQDWSDLVVSAPPLYIQEKVHPQVLIEDLLAQTKAEQQADENQLDLFADFNGIPTGVDRTEFYQHDQNWSNRMILGDSLQVMASLAEREGLRGKVQCIYFDPPYGIAFNSNFQWSTINKNVMDGKIEHITREPEQVKAFRDTWRDGIHSYLTYLRDRLTVARDLLTQSGSIFVQIGDENLHRVRTLMDEVFGDQSFIVTIPVKKKGNQKSSLIDPVNDYLLWYGRSPRHQGQTRFHPLFEKRDFDAETLRRFCRVVLPDGREFPLESVPDPKDVTKTNNYKEQPTQLAIDWPGARLFYPGEQLTSGGERPNQSDPVEWEGKIYRLKSGLCWKTTTRTSDGTTPGMFRLQMAKRLVGGRGHLNYKRFLDDFGYTQLTNWWDRLGGASNAIYVVQTNDEIVKRCILMTTDPGDLVLDPTCGSGTTATVAEQWGRRWITIDTSRVALALSRARIMGARYPYYLLMDSREGQEKKSEITCTAPSSLPVHGNIRHGFVYEQVPHIMLSSIANNAEIDVVWDKWKAELEPLREKLNTMLKQTWQEWEIPYEPNIKWPNAVKELHARWWQALITRQQEIDKSIAVKAEPKYLYDKPYTDNKKVRVAGPFTVESLSPHRTLGIDENDELIDPANSNANHNERQTFAQMILENLKTAGVQQAHKEDKITFSALTPWPGDLICADGRYSEGKNGTGIEKRAAIFIGSEFGTVQRADLVAAAREAGDADFDVLIACAFNYEAHATEFSKLGRIPVLKARMNADLHMGADLKNTGKGNLFVIFGEPDIQIIPAEDDKIQIKLNGVDVFHPQTGEVRSDTANGIACWFIDTDYNEESFFVRHAYFLGANDPYSALKITLKAEINAEAWATLNRDISRAFAKPASGRIAVKVIALNRKVRT
jgi:adenine-specific DNA-methyltransferase